MIRSYLVCILFDNTLDISDRHPSADTFDDSVKQRGIQRRFLMVKFQISFNMSRRSVSNRDNPFLKLYINPPLYSPFYDTFTSLDIFIPLTLSLKS